MPMGDAPRLHSAQGEPAPGEPRREDASQEASPEQKTPADAAAKSKNRLADHKGKLAVGAAAMLGLAIFYKWRDSKLAKDDPEEYARLRRLKAAVDTEESKPHKKT